MDHPKMSRRILEAKSGMSIDKKKIIYNRGKAKKFEMDFVFKFGISPLIDISTYKIVFEHEGLDLNKIGLWSIINKEKNDKLPVSDGERALK